MRKLKKEESENFHEYENSPMMESILNLDTQKKAIIEKLKFVVKTLPPDFDDIKSIVVEAAQIYNCKVLDDSKVAEIAEHIAQQASHTNERHLYLILRQKLNASE